MCLPSGVASSAFFRRRHTGRKQELFVSIFSRVSGSRQACSTGEASYQPDELSLGGGDNDENATRARYSIVRRRTRYQGRNAGKHIGKFVLHLGF